jgi:hypothetical protein
MYKDLCSQKKPARRRRGGNTVSIINRLHQKDNIHLLYKKTQIKKTMTGPEGARVVYLLKLGGALISFFMNERKKERGSQRGKEANFIYLLNCLL